MSRHVLRNAAAEGPVLALNLDQADEDVVRPQPRLALEVRGDRGIERLLLGDAAGVGDGDLVEGLQEKAMHAACNDALRGGGVDRAGGDEDQRFRP